VEVAKTPSSAGQRPRPKGLRHNNRDMAASARWSMLFSSPEDTQTLSAAEREDLQQLEQEITAAFLHTAS